MKGFPLLPFAAEKEKAGERNRGQQQRHGPLRQYSQTERRIKRIEPQAAPRGGVVQSHEEENEGHGETCRERHIHRGGAGKSEATNGRRQNQRRDKAGCTVPQFSTTPIDEEHAERGTES